MQTQSTTRGLKWLMAFDFVFVVMCLTLFIGCLKAGDIAFAVIALVPVAIFGYLLLVVFRLYQQQTRTRS